MSVATERRLSIEGADQQLLAGVNDSNLTTLARHCDIRVVLRRDEMILSGPQADVDSASPTARRMIRYARLRRPFDAVDVERFLAAPPDGDGGSRSSKHSGGLRPSGGARGSGRSGRNNSGTSGASGAAGAEGRQAEVALAGARRAIKAKSPGQDKYLAAMRERDIVVGIGPAGTGKTYLAVAAAVEALNRKRIRRIILTRPAVEAGEALGFLPGDIREKVDPYLRPLYDALEDMMPQDRVRRAIEDGVIEVAPLAYMRGRTLSDAFLILDEAQNATTAQMKMFLTRLGLNSKTVITGDKTQIDLPRPADSGLLEIEEVLRDVDGIDFVYLDDADVVRHRLVKEIIRAYRESER
ncbi:PhoH family protein [Candidatus Palauibacter sp.]|uniref:PhoH family protein n=1 Tax=Candidatus Palauibacter sp. TaxID=3101350 RepID=UPI003B528700